MHRICMQPAYPMTHQLYSIPHYPSTCQSPKSVPSCRQTGRSLDITYALVSPSPTLQRNPKARHFELLLQRPFTYFSFFFMVFPVHHSTRPKRSTHILRPSSRRDLWRDDSRRAPPTKRQRTNLATSLLSHFQKGVKCHHVLTSTTTPYIAVCP